jgi:hypothetical protein
MVRQQRCGLRPPSIEFNTTPAMGPQKVPVVYISASGKFAAAGAANQ